MSPAQSQRAGAAKEYVTPDVVPGLRKPAAAVKTPRQPKLPADIDWEAVIGGRWMTWVGAFTLLLAVGFGVHWAWSTLQTPPWVHVLSIHVLGAGFLVAAHFINRRGLPLAARALVGLGIFTLYAAAFAALHLYKLWPEQTAFIECAGLTAMAIALALRANSPAVVILGALGGYLTPILTASGSGNYVGLFTYLAFLNIALVGCAVWRNWSFLKPLALAATVLMFGGWLANSRFDPSDNAMVWGTEWFAVLHSAIFLFGSTAPPVIWKRTSNRHDLFALVVTSFSFVGLTWVLFQNRPDEQMALVSWGMSALHAVLFGITFARVTNVDRMPRVHLALAAVFFTLAIPLQLNDSSYWGATWCVEGFIFTAVGVYFADRQMCTTAAIVLLLAVGRLAGWDWASAPRLITGTSIDMRCAMFVVGGLMTLFAGGLYRLIPWVLARESKTKEFDAAVAGMLAVLGALLLFAAPMLQLHDWIYLGPIWSAEALAFVVAGLVIGDLRYGAIGMCMFAAAAARLIGFDFLTAPARSFGNTLVDLRCAAFACVGMLAIGGAIIARMVTAKRPAQGASTPSTPWESLIDEIFPREFALALSPALLMLGAILITCAAPLQLIDWTNLGPVWAIEAVVFIVFGIMFSDRLLGLIGLSVFLAAIVRLFPCDYFLLPRLWGGTGFDVRFVVLEVCGLLAIAAAGMYLWIPKLLRRSSMSDQTTQAIAGVLAGAGNLLLMLGCTRQWDDRLVLVLWTIDAAAIWALGFWRKQIAIRWYAAGLAIFMVGCRAIYDHDRLDGAYQLLMNSRFGSLALVAAVYFAAGWMYRHRAAAQRLLHGNTTAQPFLEFADWDESMLDPILGILGNIVLLSALSMEIHSWYLLAAANGWTPFVDMHMAEMATYSIVWAIYAAIVVAIGFAMRHPLFRILGLVAFGPILLKVFFIDMESLRLLPRVLALAVLGLMLLGVSMLYQKFFARMERSA
jgi:Predicted membrane protein (DUF2339)